MRSLYLFGYCRIESETGPVHLPTRKVESLLAYLVLRPEEHTREQLAALFWGDVSDTQARASLRNALAILRRQLGEELLLTDRDTVQLNPAFPLWVDALDFQVQATQFLSAPSPDPSAVDIELYTGDLLMDFYDNWVLADRERYRDLYLDTLLRRVEEMRSRSEYERAIEFAHKVLASDAANERAHQHLMFCYVALGDRSAALRQYEACQRALREELAVEPSPATKALYQWIQQAPAEMKPIEAQITNLPIPLTSFIGRKREMAEVKRLLTPFLTPSPASPGEGVRLLTLTGAGGSGKTRLAIHVATDLVDVFKDGVWWVELAALTDEALVPHAVAKALGVREVPNQPLSETLVNFLRSRHLLLALDNCEHLIAACAQIAEQLLSACPHLKILATSREALSVTGESVWYVPTLSVPDPQPVSLVDLLMQYEAIHLFVERAAAVKSDFALTERNALPVAQVCRRLDGIPLALELAAARVKVLSVEQIAARLDDRFNLLTGGSRTALPRHQTLRAAIDWSYDLLPDKERALFRCLSAFAGGWTLEAAEAVCAETDETGRLKDEVHPSSLTRSVHPSEVFNLLTHLVDKSLVAIQAHSGEARYRMLETIRQYAQEKLLESDEAERVQSRHLDFFMKLAEEAEPHLRSADQVTWLDRLETEHDNLRVALECSIASNAEAGLRLAVALIGFWRVRGYWSEGHERLQAVLTVEESRSVTRGITWSKALSGLAWLSGLQGDYTTDFFEERLASYRELGDKRGTASLLNILGVKEEMQGDYEQAKTFLAESLALRRDVGDKADIVESLINLGRLVRFQGDYRQATVLIEEGLALSQELEDKWSIAWARMHLGYIAMLRGNAKEAVALFIDSLLQFMQVGDKLLIDNNLFGLGMAAVMQGNSVRSAQLFGAAEALRENIGYPTSPGQRALSNARSIQARAASWPKQSRQKAITVSAVRIAPGRMLRQAADGDPNAGSVRIRMRNQIGVVTIGFSVNSPAIRYSLSCSVRYRYSKQEPTASGTRNGSAERQMRRASDVRMSIDANPVYASTVSFGSEPPSQLQHSVRAVG